LGRGIIESKGDDGMAETIDLKTWQDRINQLRQWQPATPELWSLLKLSGRE